MEEKVANVDSEFCKIFGYTPRNKILEFFLEMDELDFSMGDIVEETGLNRATTYNTMKELIREQFVIPSRKSTNAQLYKLNKNNNDVLYLMSVFRGILAKIVDDEVLKNVKKDKGKIEQKIIELDHLGNNTNELIKNLEIMKQQINEMYERLLEKPVENIHKR